MTKITEVKKEAGALVPAETKEQIKVASDIVSNRAQMFIQEIRDEMKKNDKLVGYFGNVKVRSAADLETAVAVLAAIKTYYKSKDVARDEIIGPIKSAIKEADAAWKKFKDYIEATIGQINGEISDFRVKEAARIAKVNAEREAKAEAERKRIEAEAAKAAKAKGADKAFVDYQKQEALAKTETKFAPKEQATTVGGTSFRSIPDHEKIQAAIDKADGKVEIPGVRVFKIWDFEITDSKAIPEIYRKESASTKI